MPSTSSISKRGRVVGHTLIDGQQAEIREREIAGFKVRTSSVWSNADGEPVVVMITDAQLASLLQVSVKTVWRWVDRGEMLEPDDIVGESQWNLAEVINWLNEGNIGNLLSNIHADEWLTEAAGSETPPDDIEELAAERRGIK